MSHPANSSSRRHRLKWMGAGAGLLAVAVALYALYVGRDAPNSTAGTTIQEPDASIAEALAPELQNKHILTMDDVLPDERRRISSTPGVGFRFEDDFNSDGRTDLALIGQYEDGSTPRSFVLIATREDSKWTRAGLLTFDAEFPIGLKYERMLSVIYCVLCDYGSYIRWTGAEFKAEPTRPSGEP